MADLLYPSSFNHKILQLTLTLTYRNISHSSPAFALHHLPPRDTDLTKNMALKRINKELTDLGRYVDPPRWPHGHPCAQPHTEAVCISFRKIHTHQDCTVTLLLRALQALSAMIWYVVLPVTHKSPAIGCCIRCRPHASQRSSAKSLRFYTVSLASDYYGARTLSLIAVPFGHDPWPPGKVRWWLVRS